MATDSIVPLANADDFNQTAFADMALNLQEGELDTVMIQATRGVEGACRRRLAPFTITETHRAEGIDPDEYGAGLSSVPLDLTGAIGMSYAQALGGNDQVRHFWLNEFPPQFQDMWTYSLQTVEILRPIGGAQLVTGVIGPESDTGHLWLPLGTFCPIGSQVRITYSGGYSTVPADLIAGVVTWAASIIARRLDPESGSAHDPGSLRDEAVELLLEYVKN